MRKLIFLCGIAFLVWAHGARAAGPPATIQASPTSGTIPLTVSFVATAPDAASSYAWDFGDGATATDTAAIQHTYTQPGLYTATVTASGPQGTSEASVQIHAYSLTLKAPAAPRYGRRATFGGRLLPGVRNLRVELRRNGARVGAARTRADGRFRIRLRIRAPGKYQAAYDAFSSPPQTVRVRPVLNARLAGAPLVGSSLVAVVGLRPASAGTIHVTVVSGRRTVVDKRTRGATRVRLPTSSVRVFRLELRTEAAPGFLRAARTLRVSVTVPTLSLGSRGASVRLLEQRLLELHYALRGVDGYYGDDDFDAIIAFQKVNWLQRTGRVDRGLWLRLEHASTPRARYRSGDHIEVDKGRQVLFDVRGGQVVRVVEVSTGATGNTPTGVFHVYSKTAGFNEKLMYYSMYFLRGFAIHGYPDVPPFPASHGCVRVPLWVAFSLYATHPYGTTVILY